MEKNESYWRRVGSMVLLPWAHMQKWKQVMERKEKRKIQFKIDTPNVLMPFSIICSMCKIRFDNFMGNLSDL